MLLGSGRDKTAAPAGRLLTKPAQPALDALRSRAITALDLQPSRFPYLDPIRRSPLSNQTTPHNRSVPQEPPMAAWIVLSLVGLGMVLGGLFTVATMICACVIAFRRIARGY